MEAEAGAGDGEEMGASVSGAGFCRRLAEEAGGVETSLVSTSIGALRNRHTPNAHAMTTKRAKAKGSRPLRLEFFALMMTGVHRRTDSRRGAQPALVPPPIKLRFISDSVPLARVCLTLVDHGSRLVEDHRLLSALYFLISVF